MAGVKGRSGGARPGAGRPPKAPAAIDVQPGEDPKTVLLAIMNDPGADGRLRLDAAKALMPFMHAKIGEAGKKAQRQEEAGKVGGRFAAGSPPKLAAAGGKRL